MNNTKKDNDLEEILKKYDKQVSAKNRLEGYEIMKMIKNESKKAE